MRAKRMLAFVLAFVMLFSLVGVSDAFIMETHAEEVQTYEEYNYLGYNENQMLPGENKYLGTQMGYYLQDEEHPEGEEFDLPVIRVEMEQMYFWGEDGERIPTDEELFYLEGNANDGWNLCADDYGSVDLTVYFEGLNGKMTNQQCTVYAVNEIYYLNWELPKDTEQMLTESEMTVSSYLTRNYRNDENGENIYDEPVEDYILFLLNEYDENALTVDIADNGKDVVINSKEYENTSWLSFAAVRAGEDSLIEYTQNGFHVYVCNGFFNFEPGSLENVELGEILDLSEIKVVLYNHKFPEGIDLTADLRLRVGHYDEHVWEPVEEVTEDGLVNFKRISTDGGNINLFADDKGGEDGWHEVAQRSYRFDSLDYHVWFDNLQYGEWGCCYEGTNQVFTINTDNLLDKENYEIRFEAGLNVEEKFVPFEDQEELFKVVEDDGQIIGIEVKTDALVERKDQLNDGGWFDLCVVVFVDGEEISRDWRGIELRQGFVDYQYEEWGFSMLPYWDHGINKEIGVHVNNAEHPDGHDTSVYATDLRVEYVDGWEDCLDITEWEDGTGWNIHANDYCHAIITMVHPSINDSEEEIEHSFDVWVGGDVWNLDLKSSTGGNEIRPGGEMDLYFDISRECFNMDEGHFEGDASQVAYRWGYNEGAREDLVEVNFEGDYLHIVAKDDAELDSSTWIWVRAYEADEEGNILQDEEGNGIEVAYCDIEIWIRNDFLKLLPLELDADVELGESFEITPQLFLVYEAGEDELNNAVYRYDWDPEMVELRNEDGEVLTKQEDNRSEFTEGTVTVKKLSAGDTNIEIIAYRLDADGDYEENYSRWYYVSPKNYDIWFEKDRGSDDWSTFVFEYETDYELPLNTDSLRDEDGNIRENITIEWTVGERDENGTFARNCTEGEEYEFNDDKTAISLNAPKMLENNFDAGINIDVVVKVNGIATSEDSYQFYVWIAEDKFSLEDEVNDTLLGENFGWRYENDTMYNYVRNSLYPRGETLEFEIRDIQQIPTDGNEEPVFEITHSEDGLWRVAPLRLGAAEVIYTLYHKDFGEIAVSRERYVVDETYSLGLFSDTHCWEMLPEDELQIIPEVYQYTSNGDGGYDVCVVPRERYEFYYEYNTDVVDIDENLHVKSHKHYDMTGVYIEAHVTMLDGETVYNTSNYIGIQVQPEIWKLYADPFYMEPEDVVNVNDLGIKIVHVRKNFYEEYEVDGFELDPSKEVTISEDGQTLQLAVEIPQEDLPVTLRLGYEGYFQGESAWDWVDIIVCRHDFTDWVVETEPSATEEGLEIRDCKNCGKHEENVLEKTSVPVNTVFSDVYKDWYIDYVQYVYDYKLMTGIKGTTRFEPNANITKAQVAQVLYNMEGQPEVTNKKVFNDLKDVYSGEWYANAVAWAYNTGVVTGDTNAKKFFPNADVTREQLALMMFRYASYKKYDVSASSDLAGLKNAENTANWAMDGVKWAVGQGLISGIDKNGVKDLAPQGNASRAQVAAILQRFCKAYK